jgi:hypothetical protein
MLLILVIFGLSSTGSLLAQDTQTKQEKQAITVKEKIKKLGLGERVKVKVKLYNETSYQGYVSQANDDDFVVVDKSGNPNTVKYADVKSVGGKNLSTGAKIAIGIGIGVGATILVIVAIFASLNS